MQMVVLQKKNLCFRSEIFSHTVPRKNEHLDLKPCLEQSIKPFIVFTQPKREQTLTTNLVDAHILEQIWHTKHLKCCSFVYHISEICAPNWFILGLLNIFYSQIICISNHTSGQFTAHCERAQIQR